MEITEKDIGKYCVVSGETIKSFDNEIGKIKDIERGYKPDKPSIEYKGTNNQKGNE